MTNFRARFEIYLHAFSTIISRKKITRRRTPTIIYTKTTPKQEIIHQFTRYMTKAFSQFAQVSANLNRNQRTASQIRSKATFWKFQEQERHTEYWKKLLCTIETNETNSSMQTTRIHQNTVHELQYKTRFTKLLSCVFVSLDSIRYATYTSRHDFSSRKWRPLEIVSKTIERRWVDVSLRLNYWWLIFFFPRCPRFW